MALEFTLSAAYKYQDQYFQSDFITFFLHKNASFMVEFNTNRFVETQKQLQIIIPQVQLDILHQAKALEDDLLKNKQQQDAKNQSVKLITIKMRRLG